jgi:hypothetical protein
MVSTEGYLPGCDPCGAIISIWREASTFRNRLSDAAVSGER